MVFEVPEDSFGDDLIKFLKEDKEFARLFPQKEQRDALIAVFARFAIMHDYHEYEDTHPHNETIGKEIVDLTAKFRNHRHETGKVYSAKPEY